MTAYTTNLRLTQPTVGGDTNTWGTSLNTDMSLIDSAIEGRTSVNINGLTTYTLTSSNGASDEARQPIITFTGTLSANCTVTIPASYKHGWVINATSGGKSVILTTGSGTTLTVANAYWNFFNCDGTNVTSPTQFFSTLYATNCVIGTLAVSGSVAVTGAMVVGGTLTGNALVVAAGAAITGGTTNTVASLGDTFHTFSVTGTGTVGSIVSTAGGATVYNTTSDYRLKTILHDFVAERAIEEVPVYFGHYNRDPGRPRAMFFAHEVQKVAPWAVSGEKDAVRHDGGIEAQMLDHMSLVPILWEAVQSLQRKVRVLEARHDSTTA